MSDSLAVTDPDGRDPAAGLMGLAIFLVLVFIVVFVGGNVFALYQILVFSGGDGFGGFIGSFIAFGPLLGLADLFIISGFLGLLVRMNQSVESERRRHRHVITEGSYRNAPMAVQAVMASIFASATSLNESRAYRDGMFGDLDVDRALYAAAKHAVQASQINGKLRRLKTAAGAADEDALGRARAALHEIGRQLEAVDDQLADAAKIAMNLSKKVDAAERARETAHREELAAERTREARNRLRAQLEESTAQAKASTELDATEVSDRVAAVSEGYDEAHRVSDAVLGNPGGEPASPPSVAQSVWNIARAAISWLTR